MSQTIMSTADGNTRWYGQGPSTFTEPRVQSVWR